MNLNKDYADNLILAGLSTFSIYETLIKEIEKIQPNIFLILNIIKKKYVIKYNDLLYYDQKQNAILLNQKKH